MVRSSYEKIGDAPQRDQINRATQQVLIKNAYGEDFTVEVNDELTVSQVKQEIGKRTGVPGQHQHLVQNGNVMDDYASLQNGQHVDLTYNMNGGAAFELVTKVPDVIHEKCFCFECGTKDMPKWETEDFITSSCFCISSQCGMSDMWKIQCFCLVLDLKPVKFSIDSRMPELIRTQCLIYKCGLQSLMDIMKENFIENTCFCLESHCNLSDPMNWFQFFCLKLTV